MDQTKNGKNLQDFWRERKLTNELPTKRLRLIPALFFVLVMASVLTACVFGGTRYHVDYMGRKSAYTGAKDWYPAGAQVRLYYENWATDTDYSFYLDGEPINYSWDDEHGFVIEFTMPAHDVVLSCETENTMMVDPNAYEEAMLMIEFSRLDVDYEAKEAETGYTMQVFEPDGGEAEVLVVTLDGATDRYAVGEEIIDDVFLIAEEAGMKDWDREYDSVYQDLDAYTYMSMLWLDRDEAYFTDYNHLPEDGEAVFEQIEERLWRDLDEAHLIIRDE